MIATIQGLRALAGDALIAIGEAVRGGSPNIDFTLGTSRVLPLPEPAPAPIPTTEIRAAFDELPDSALLTIAATILASWRLALLGMIAGRLIHVDVLVDTLRDRAAQFRVVEDVRSSYPSTPPTSSSRRGE